MDSLFVRVYLKLLLSLVAVGLTSALLVVPRIEARLAHNIEATMSPPIVMMSLWLSDARAEGRPVAVTLERGAKAFHTEARIIPEAEASLDEAQRRRLAGDEVVMSPPIRSSYAYVKIKGTGELLVLGPFNPVHPFGEGRGLAILVLLAAGMLFGAFLLLSPINRRLAALARATARFGAGELGVRTAAEQEDSIGRLSHSFNQMAGEIQRLLAAQQELMRTVSHELRTPIQRMHFALEQVRSARDEEGREKAAQRLETDLDELDELIDELLTYARLRDVAELPRTQVDLGAVVRDTGEALSQLGRKVSLHTHQPESCAILVSADAKLLRRAISNLVLNGFRHARTEVALSLSEADGLAFVKVEDDGPGVPEIERERIFEPFRSGESPMPDRGQGFGLGLAIVRRVAERFEGKVDVGSSSLGGACFQLALPRAPSSGTSAR